jgi:glycosyltransferase involved in cell wall biosynthesis
MTITVAHIRDSSGIFGAERVILTLAKNLSRQNFRVLLVCLQRPGGGNAKLVQRATSLGIEVKTVAVYGRFDPRAIAMLRKILRKNQVSVIHSHDFKSDFYGLLASRGSGIKRVATAHGSTRDSLFKRLYLFFDEHFVYPRLDRIIAVSAELQERLRNQGIPSEKISLIPNGLDLDLLSAEADNSEPPLAIPSGKKVFGLIGRLFPDKGHRFFLQALAGIAREHPEAHGLIVGAGPEEDNIIRRIDELGLKDRVLFVGTRNNMQLVYDAIDALVIPSLTEGLPYVLLEAMANKIPVIASAVGDIPLLIKQGETGYLVPPGDEKKLAMSMTDLLSFPEKSDTMARQATEFFQKNYAAAPMARATERIYCDLLHWGESENLQVDQEP